MLIQMVCFFLMLVVVGGLISLPIMVDPNDAHRAPYPFAASFAGLAAFTLVVVGYFVSKYVSDTAGGVIILLMAPTVGLSGGGLFGYRLGLSWARRVRRADSVE
jgi:hypothetical protein